MIRQTRHYRTAKQERRPLSRIAASFVWLTAICQLLFASSRSFASARQALCLAPAELVDPLRYQLAHSGLNRKNGSQGLPLSWFVCLDDGSRPSRFLRDSALCNDQPLRSTGTRNAISLHQRHRAWLSCAQPSPWMLQLSLPHTSSRSMRSSC